MLVEKKTPRSIEKQKKILEKLDEVGRRRLEKK